MQPLNLILIVTINADQFDDPTDILHALGDDLTFDCELTMKTALIQVRRLVADPTGHLHPLPEQEAPLS